MMALRSAVSYQWAFCHTAYLPGERNTIHLGTNDLWWQDLLADNESYTGY